LRGEREGKLTAITHDDNLGIDTMVIPRPPVRIHARIGRHRVVHVERRGRAMVAQKKKKVRRGKRGKGGRRRR
jgi:hypothetical protein